MRAALATLAFAAPAAAEPRLEVGAMTGGHRFARDLELGVTDGPDQGSPGSTGLIGARLGWGFAPRLAAEAELVWLPTEDRMSGADATVLGYRGHLIGYMADALPVPVRPFLVVGAGWLAVDGGGALGDDTDFTYHWGGGVRWEANDWLAVRADARHILAPDVGHNGVANDLELTAGIALRFDPMPTGSAPRPRARDERLPPPAVQRIENDSDRDGLADAVDDCPTESEVVNNHEDDDGCPDRVLIEVDGIGFRPGSFDVTPASIPILERAIAMLKESPTWRVAIEGHTSSDGDRYDNLALSKERADAVAAYLVSRGIAAERITTRGYGPDKPIANDRTAAGREKNRRIEFRIVDRP